MLQKGYKITIKDTQPWPDNIFRNKADIRFDSATFLQFILWIFMYRQDKNMTQQMLNSHILGSSLANLSIKNLREGVEFTLRNKQPVAVCVCVFTYKLYIMSLPAESFLIYLLTSLPQGNYEASCVFWDFDKNGEIAHLPEFPRNCY